MVPYGGAVFHDTHAALARVESQAWPDPHAR